MRQVSTALAEQGRAKQQTGWISIAIVDVFDEKARSDIAGLACVAAWIAARACG
jgi:hypothetical protein